MQCERDSTDVVHASRGSLKDARRKRRSNAANSLVGPGADCGTRTTRASLHICAATIIFCLGGCTTYHPLPLASRPDLLSGLAHLDLTLPPRQGDNRPTKLNPAKPLTPSQLGMVAVLNDPALAEIKGKIAAADAGLLAASLLPNPSVGIGYAFLMSGPAEDNAYNASLSQDVRSIVTYRPRVEAAKARVGQVAADSLWQEWQVAQKARLLAIEITSSDQQIRFREKNLVLLRREVAAVRQAAASGYLSLPAKAPFLATEAAAETNLAAAKLQRLKDWQDLDALLGLQPAVRFAIAAPPPPKLPATIAPLIASLPQRRPDLIALRLGYQAADAQLRAAIIGQFPAFNLGVSGRSDTSHVVTLGPQITFALPIFNRNQAAIAGRRATRLQLHAAYLSRLDQADGMAQSLLVRARTAATDLRRARHEGEAARALLEAAEKAYRQGNLDQRAVVDYETALLDRELDIVGYRQALEEDSFALSVELGLGLPETLISAPDAKASRT